PASTLFPYTTLFRSSDGTSPTPWIARSSSLPSADAGPATTQHTLVLPMSRPTMREDLAMSVHQGHHSTWGPNICLPYLASEEVRSEEHTSELQSPYD